MDVPDKERLHECLRSDIYKKLCTLRMIINRDPPRTERIRERFLAQVQYLVSHYNIFPEEWKRANPFDTEGLLRKLAFSDDSNLLSRPY